MNGGTSAIDSWAAQRDERDRQSLRSGMIASGLGHLAFLFVLVFAPTGDPHPMSAVVAVDLLAALPAAPPAPAPKPAAPKAAPAPKPPPAEPVVVPPPEPPKQAKTVLPKEAPKAVPKKPVAKKPARKPVPPKRTEPLDYEDAMAALRDEVGEPSPLKPAEKVADAPPLTGAPAGRGRLAPEVARWQAGVQALIDRTWVVPQEMRQRGLATTLAITVMADGTLIGVEVKRSSGDPYFDDNAVRALKQAEILPPPPSAGEHYIVFSPSE